MARVSLDNVIIKDYREILNSGVHEIPASLQAALATIDIPKKGGQRKIKALVLSQRNQSNKESQSLNQLWLMKI